MTSTIYIIGWNGDQWLPACLENLHRASRERLHLVLIDNHNNPGIAKLPLERFETRVVKTPRKMGFADAHNFGIVAAPPPPGLVVLLNQDTQSADGWIDHCTACFEQDPALGVLMPGLRTYADDGWDVNFLECAKANPTLLARLDAPTAGAGGKTPSCHRVPVVTAAAMVVRTQVLANLGLFDPIFESYYEDYDFCRRVREAGWMIGICPEARVRHFVGSATDSPEAVMRRHRWVLRNRVIHQARSSGDKRLGYFVRHFIADFPRRIARSLLHTNSSQPFKAILLANLDLMLLIPRLISAKVDCYIWHRDLVRMGWITIRNNTK